MTLALAASGPTAYWYTARGTGVVAQLLLTVAVVLGILDARRFTAPRWPRFVIDRVHRDVSLLVLAVLVVHIVTSVLDSFAPIRLLDAVLPLGSTYRPLWLGLGALSFDVLLAVAITSVVRRRLGYRAWRAIHWLAYVSWPVAIFHGLGTGTDAASAWLLAVTAACLVAVVLATAVRFLAEPAGALRGRPLWLGLCVVIPLALAVFVWLGPLAPHWARRSGTPLALLRKAHPASYAASSGPAARAPVTRFSVPFTAQLSGTVSQTPAAGGALVDLVLNCTGDIQGELRVRLAGAPIPGGGLSMTGSQVQLTASGLTSALQGTVSQLQNNAFVAQVRDRAGTSLRLRARLNIDQADNTVTGTLNGAGA